MGTVVVIFIMHIHDVVTRYNNCAVFCIIFFMITSEMSVKSSQRLHCKNSLTFVGNNCYKFFIIIQ